MTDQREPYWPYGFLAEFKELAESGDVTSERLLSMYERAAEEIVAGRVENPRRSLMESRGEHAGFSARLEARWGDAFDLFELTVEHVLDTGRWVNERYRPDAAARQDQKFEALIRLHGRAAMTAEEVLVLLRAGFATGALARWRTLHEIWVVFSLLAEADGELSRRYLVHEAIESMKAQEEYEETWEALGQDPPDTSATEREKLRAELAKEFGEAFVKDYGWAAPLFDDNAPKFRQLQERAELDHWRGYYRMASHGTHANPKGITWNLQAPIEVPGVWAGPSNAGLVDPAQCALIALTNITVGLLAYVVRDLADGEDALYEHTEALVRQQAGLMLMERAIDEFTAVDSRQQAEEDELAKVIDAATTALRAGGEQTLEALADQLGMDTEMLEEAMSVAVTRGLVDQDVHFHAVEEASDDAE